MSNRDNPEVNLIILSAKIIGVLILLIIGWSSFHTITCDPGEEVVLVDQPYLFGHGGVQNETMKQGREFFWKSTDGWGIPTRPQSITIAFDDLSSKDNILLDFKSAIQLRVVDPVALVKKFGTGAWFGANLESQYSSIVRQAVKSQNMSDIMSNAAVSTQVDNEITVELVKFVKEKGIPIEILNVTLGRAKPNEKVLEQMNKTASEQQRVKTLTAAVNAEHEREQSELARAQADNAYRNEMHLDTIQFVALEQAKLYSEACKASSHCIVTSGQSPLTMPTK